MTEDKIQQCSTAIGIANQIWHKEYGQTMLVDRSVTDALEACHVSNKFNQSKWPSSSLNIIFQNKSYHEVTISKGNHSDIIQTAWDFVNHTGDMRAKEYLAALCVEWGPDEKGIPQWMDDVIMYTMQTPLGLVFGNLPSEAGEDEIREGMTTFVNHQEYDDVTINFMETTLMALKVINYSAIPHFAPTKITKWDKKEWKSAKKTYNVRGKKSLFRVVYLPKVVRDYQSKKGQKKTGPLKNGRVGHLRSLRSDYFVNKQGEDVLIPPIPDINGRYPKIIYKVKKSKSLAA